MCDMLGVSTQTLSEQSTSGVACAEAEAEAGHRLPLPADDLIFLADVEETEKHLQFITWVKAPSSITLTQGAAFDLGVVEVVVINDSGRRRRHRVPY